MNRSSIAKILPGLALCFGLALASFTAFAQSNTGAANTDQNPRATQSQTQPATQAPNYNRGATDVLVRTGWTAGLG